MNVLQTMRTGDEDQLRRIRNWTVGLVLVIAVIVAAILGRHTNGVSAGGTPPNTRFGAQLEPLVPSSRLVYTNGWIVSAGLSTIGVYAGSQATNHSNGLLVVVRTTGQNQHRRVDSIVVRGSGALTLLRPARVGSEQDAEQATLHFITASGSSGTIDLGDDRVSLGS